MLEDNPFWFLLPPEKRLDVELEQLAKDNSEIEKARARAEVAFRKEAKQGQWVRQVLEVPSWSSNAPPPERPAWWAAGVRFATTWALAYARAAAEVARGPRHFKKLVDRCVSALADWTYRNRLARYAEVRQGPLTLVIFQFTSDVRKALKEPIEELKLKTWQRYEDQLESTRPDARRKPPEEFFEVYRRKNPDMNYDQMAVRIGIPRDTLFKIKTERAWVRDDAYQAAADFLGCRPEDLHPRNLPRRRHRRIRPH